MSEQQENPPNKETETATSAEESREEHPETPPPQQSEEQPSEEEEREEEEENKKAVTEEKRPHESAGEDDDSDSQRKGKKLKESVDGDEDEEEDRNPRNVASDPVNGLDPFLERLEHDPETQMGFLTGLKHYHRINNVYPFETDEAMADFVANWLQVEVSWMALQLTLLRFWRRYTTAGATIGENLDYLNPSSRQVFLFMNRILYAYYKAADDKEEKMKFQTTPPTSPPPTSPSKSITIGRPKAPPPQDKPLKQYILVNTRRKLVLESKLKLKQKKPAYREKEKERRRWYPEKRQREDPSEEEKPREESPPAEKPSEEEEKPPTAEKPSEDPEEAAWSDANFETLNSILQGVIDYNYTLSRYPYEDVSDMDDFIKNWVGLHLSVSDCLEIIERLKRNYKKKFWWGIDHGLKFMSHKQEVLYNASDVIWNMEAHLGSDEEEEDAAEEEEEDAEEKRSADGGETVEWMPSDMKEHFDYFDAEYKRPEMRALMPHLFQKTIERGIETMRDVVVPVNKPSLGPVNLRKIKRRRRVRVLPPAVPKFQINQKNRVLPPVPKFHSTDGEDSKKQKVRLLPPVPKFYSTAGKDDENQKDRVLPPVPKFHCSDGEDGKKLRVRFLPPKFHSTAGEDNEEQKGGTGEGSSVKRDDPGAPSGQSGDDDPEKPHDQNPGNEAPAKTDEDCSMKRKDRGGPSGDDPEKPHDQNPEGGTSADCSMKRNDPGGPSGQSDDDPEKPHDENPEGGTSADCSMKRNDPGGHSGHQSDDDPEKPHDENPGNEEADESKSKSSGGEE